jgi:Cu/Ag efflux protein CusF
MEVMTKRIAVAVTWVLMAVLAGCGEKAVPEKRYPMQGEVKALDASARTATIAAGKIGDWMEAMTMEYPVKPEAEFQKLHVGDKIEATVVVADVKYYVTDIKVTAK